MKIKKYIQDNYYFVYTELLLDTNDLSKLEADKVLELLEVYINDIKTNSHLNKSIFKNIFGFKYSRYLNTKYDYNEIINKIKKASLKNLNKILKSFDLNKDIDLIDIEKFIKVKVKELINDKYPVQFNYIYTDKDKEINNVIFLEKEDIIQEANLYIIRRLKNNFKINYKGNEKSQQTINTILSYLKKSIHSSTHHYFRDVLNIKLKNKNQNKDITFKYFYMTTYDKFEYLDDSNLKQKYSSKILGPEESLLKKEEYCETLCRLLSFSKKDIKIFNDNIFNNKTQEKIAKEHGVTQQAISKRLVKIQKKLKDL